MEAASRVAKNTTRSASGLSHWLLQRFAIMLIMVLIPYIAYIFYSIKCYQWSEVIVKFKKPQNVLAISLFISVIFYHATLGMQMIIGDYVHSVWCKLFLYGCLWISSIVTTFAVIIALLYLMRL